MESGKTSRLLRRLGGYERLIHGCASVHPRHFCVVAELTSKAGPRDFRAAFAKVQRRHPLLSVYVAETGDGPAFYAADALIPVTFIPRTAASDWQRIVERELATPFPSSRAPLLRVSIIEGDGTDAVVLTFHHVGADALSGAYVIRDLMEVLDRRKLTSLPLLPSLESLVGMEAGNDGQAAQTGDQARRWSRESDPAIASTLRFSPAATDRILRACRAHETTLHGALCAAFVQSVAEPEDGIFTITSPINLRPMLSIEEGACGMLASTATMLLHLGDRNFWDLARGANIDLAAARTLGGARAALCAPGSRLPSQPGDASVARRSAVISNLGALPISDRIGSVQLNAFWGPFALGRSAEEPVLGAASIGGELRISQTTPRHIPSFLEEFGLILVANCFEG